MILIIVLASVVCAVLIAYYIYTKHNTSYANYSEMDVIELEKAKSIEKAHQDFINQHKKKDISTYEWSYLMRYRTDATAEEINKTLADNIDNMVVFDKSRDNIFTGTQFNCYFDQGIKLDDGRMYKYDYIIDKDNYVVYAYVWRV